MSPCARALQLPFATAVLLASITPSQVSGLNPNATTNRPNTTTTQTTSSRPVAVVATTSALPSGPRETWYNCTCKKNWNESAGSCNSSCCNPDNDPLGEWCMLEDPQCEDSDWGFCRPSGLGHCQNQPQGWVDSDGDSCYNYSASGWCTTHGTPGPGWRTDWGSFDKFKKDGHTARTACCACGGGSVRNYNERCRDRPGWRDDEGYRCSNYADYAWCNSTGGYGIGWHDSWGKFNAPPGEPTAVHACCACGGGADVPKAPTPVPAETVRFTWSGCQCRRQWNTTEVGDPPGPPCRNFCCNPDNDPVGPWCMVQDAKCEDETWGYCRAPSVGTDGCSNDPPTWTDLSGFDCDSYHFHNWCKADGYGDAWDPRWGRFADFASGGKSAAQVCCHCGGGHRTSAGNPEHHCTDTPGWKDVEKDTCEMYAERAYCTERGGYGAGWHSSWGTFETFASNHITATMACCACGGGRRGPVGGSGGARTPTPSTNVRIQGAGAPVGANSLNPTGGERFRWPILRIVVVMLGVVLVGGGCMFFFRRQGSSNVGGGGPGGVLAKAIGRRYAGSPSL